MAITPISQVMSNPASAVQTTASANTGMLGMGESDFMMMLMAQLKNQNPMEPMDDKNLMGQVTQLNTLRELQSLSLTMSQMAKASQASYAASLIGKDVTAMDSNGYLLAQGTVTGMEVNGSDITLTFGEESVPLAAVVLVKQPAEEGE